VTRPEFDDFCAALPAATHVVQWGGASVWKVGGKIFALCSGWGTSGKDRVAFKCSDMSYSMLLDQDGFAPAPYLARAKWIQVLEPTALNREELAAYLTAAHDIVARGLTKRLRRELGLDDA